MDERILLHNGEKYRFDNNGEICGYEISKCIGMGGNSVVYEVFCGDYEIGRLKEFYPSDVVITRDGDGNLIVSDEPSNVAEFERRRNDFNDIIPKRARLLELNLEIAKTMPEYCQLIKGYNTSYIFQSYTNGRCYSDVHGETLEDIFKTSIGLVRALKCYHDIGYVHLDIKPENMLVFSQGRDVSVQLFDYETVTSIQDLKNGTVRRLPFTEQYSSPEQIKGEYEKIDVSSDVFSVGIILFQKLMGRFPNQRNRELALGAKYDYDTKSALFNNVPLIIQRYLDDLFEHTIRVSEKPRYKEDEPFLEMLERLLSFSKQSGGIVQKKNYQLRIAELFGRQKELLVIDDCLCEKSLLLVYGMGGIGKSELIKAYLSANEDKYAKIVYIDETGASIRNAIVNDDNLKIDGLQRQDEISDDDYFDNKLETIKKECISASKANKNIIVVFDNTEFFDNLTYLNKLKETGCKIILISRDPWVGVPFDKKLQIERMDDINDEMDLFMSYLDIPDLDDNEKDSVKLIIDHYDGHPFLLQLIAKAMNSSGTLPSEMLETIDEKGISSSGEEEIRYIDNGIIRQEYIQNIAYNLFDSLDFSEEEIKAIQIMSLVPADGIEKSEIKHFICDLKSINNLVSKGFVNDSGRGYKIHPIIKEMTEHRYGLNQQAVDEYSMKIHELLSTHFSTLPYNRIALYLYIGKQIVKYGQINEADFYDALGNSCQRIGQGEYAKSYYKKTLELQKAKYGEDNEKVAVAYLRYGRVLGINGDYVESKEILEKAAKYYSEVLHNTAEPDYDIKLSAAKVYNQLARWYCDQGEWEKAMGYCKQACEISAEKADTYHRAKAKLYYFEDTRAQILFETGNYEEALGYYQDSLNLKSNMYDKEGVFFIHSYFGIAKCQYMLNEPEEALANILRAIELSEAFKGFESIDTAKIYHYTAKIYQELGYEKETLMYYDQAQNLEESILGKKNTFTLLTTVDSWHYRHFSGIDKITLDDYLEIKERIASKERPKTISIQNIYSKMQELAIAVGEDGQGW